MTTSQETDWMNHPVIRALVDQAATLALEERITLVKGLIPGIADALSEEEYEQFVTFIRLKGERYSRPRPTPARVGQSATSPASASWKAAEPMHLGRDVARGDRHGSRVAGLQGRTAERAAAPRRPSARRSPPRSRPVHAGAPHRRPRPASPTASAGCCRCSSTPPWRWTPSIGSSTIQPRDSLLATLSRQRRPALRRDQRAALGPARRQSAVRRRRRRAADGRRALSARHDEGGVRAGRGRLAGRGGPRCARPTPSCGGTRPGALMAVPVPRGLRRPDAPAAAQAARGRGAGRRRRPPHVSRAPRHGARDRRLPAERPGVDRHEDQHARRRHRPDRDLRRRAVRLQGRGRGVRAAQGQGVERAAGALRQAAPRAAARPARAGGLQARAARAPTPTSTRTTRCTTRARPTPAPRPSPSTCRTTRRCSSGRAPAGSSSRT